MNSPTRDHLLTILNRSLFLLPSVRLDSIDVVQNAYQRALDLMESNIQLDDEDEDSTPIPSSNVPLRVNPSLAHHHPLMKNTPTQDFSSPSAAKRSLGGSPSNTSQSHQNNSAPPKKQGGLYIGGGGPKATGGATGGGQGQPHGHKGLSSRAQHSAMGSSFVQQDDASNANAGNNSAYDDVVSPPLIVAGTVGGDDETRYVARPLPGAQPKNKLLEKVGGITARGSKEFPSPRLGGRSIGNSPATALGPRVSSAPSSTTSNSAASSAALSSSNSFSSFPADSEDEGVAILPEAGKFSSRSHSGNRTPPYNEEIPEDLVVGEKGKAKSAGSTPSLNSAALVPSVETDPHLLPNASPKQIKSSLRLLTLAGKLDESKVNEIPPEGTPKPGYLRRLDSPESHHGQLITGKTNLQLLINKAIQHVPNVKTSAIPQIHRALQHALETLEQSLAQQTVMPGPGLDQEHRGDLI